LIGRMKNLFYMLLLLPALTLWLTIRSPARAEGHTSIRAPGTGPVSGPPDTLTITSTSGSAQTNRLVSISRVFREGEIRAAYHSYGFEFQAAISHLTDFTVDGSEGSDAWAWMKALKPYQDKFATAELSIKPLPNYPVPAVPNVRSETGQLDMALGWHQLPNTKMEGVCPPEGFGSTQGDKYDFHAGCISGGPISAWNSAVADIDHNRLIIWGGGHNDYYGNEVYVVDLNGTPAITRVTSPTVPSNYKTRNCGCPDGLPALGSCPNPSYGTAVPNGRHTYNQMVYLPGYGKMLEAGGVPACTNVAGMGTSSKTWGLDTENWTWGILNDGSGMNPGWPFGGVTGWDPVRRMVLFATGNDLMEFNPANNTWIARTTGQSAQIDGHMTGEVDPVHNLFFMIGGYAYDPTVAGIRVFDISNTTNWRMQTNWKQSGCEPIINNLFPGVAWDSSQDKLVMWAQDGTSGGGGAYSGTGNTVYIASVNKAARTLTCTSQTFAGGPPSSPKNSSSNGTLGRWRYFRKTAQRPDLGVFVVVVGVHDNAYYLRLN
jgi:hypothetical protein